MNKLCRSLAVIVLVPALFACSTAPSDPDVLKDQVADVERAFAATMADRDHAAFASFLSQEAVFISGPVILRGRQAVADSWKRYFEGQDPPFSWEPETVSVLDSGKLAISSGPVRNPEGKRMATYTSIWRQEEPGVWRIVFDKGAKYCE